MAKKSRASKKARMTKLEKDQIERKYEYGQGREYHEASEQERYCRRVNRYSNQCQSKDVWIYGLDLD